MGAGGGGLRVGEYLEVVDAGGQRRFRCLRCGQDLGPASENYKARAKARERPMDVLGGYYPGREHSRFVFREYFCPGCATQLDVEVTEPGAPPRWELQLD